MEQNINDEALLAIKMYGMPKMPLPKEKRRVFKGQKEFVLDYSTPETLAESKRNRHFHQRMLRAYLKGATQFNFGFRGRDLHGNLIPDVHEVLQAWE